jgi:subtilisin family serine protease
MNLSLGSNEPNTAEREAFQRAMDENILVVAASGNDSNIEGAAPVGFPAAYPGVIAVGAINETKAIANFSNQGPELSLVAPGVRVLSLARKGSTTIGAIQTPATEIAGRGINGSPRATVTGKLIYCGSGSAAGDFPASVAGNIALIQREGVLTLNQRASNAKAAGAAAVIIYNNTGGAVDWTYIIETDPTAASFDWPLSVGLTKEDGDILRRDENATVSVTFREDDYSQKNGTSMATPHVAGAAALVWALAPSAPASAVRNALLNTASDLGDAGFDQRFGYGVVDAVTAAKLLAPAAFNPKDTVPSGRRTLRRGR